MGGVAYFGASAPSGFGFSIFTAEPSLSRRLMAA
jgi:hypothetical protein